jgi:hypothetical protein
VNFIVKENSKRASLAAWYLGFKSVAIVFGKTIFLHNISEQNFRNDKRHLAHELCHVRQFQQYGFFRFLFLYLVESIKNGYFNNRFEVEARKAEEE